MDINLMTRAELEKYVKSKAKTANSRLTGIEKKGLTKASNAYKHFEADKYYNAPYMAKNKAQKPRFRESFKKMTTNQLRAEAAQLDTFLGAKTSSVRGINKKYKTAYKSFMKGDGKGSGMSFEEYAQFWAEENTRKMVEMYGSQVLIELKEMTAKDFNATINALRHTDIKAGESYVDVLDKIEDNMIDEEAQAEIAASIFD